MRTCDYKETLLLSHTEPPPSSPLNLTIISSPTHSNATISWVAPLDAPLCVHSYTITVRNSCNSSQVMVYNTTDNRSSLNITDLTSDDEYSVTVAGRDGAGRLGQEKEEWKLYKGYIKLHKWLCTFLMFYALSVAVRSSQNRGTWILCLQQQCFILLEGIYSTLKIVVVFDINYKYIPIFAASGAIVLSIGPVSDHTQCKFRPVSNNSQQHQCDTVWSTTRRNIHCGDHSLLVAQTRRTP